MEALMMERPTNSWNDDRLDELNRRVDEGFKEMREGFARVDERFTRVDERFARVDDRFEAMGQRFESMGQRFESMGQRFATKDDMNKGFSEVKGELRHLNERLDRLMYGLMVAGVSFGLTTFATVAGLFVTQA